MKLKTSKEQTKELLESGFTAPRICEDYTTQELIEILYEYRYKEFDDPEIREEEEFFFDISPVPNSRGWLVEVQGSNWGHRWFGSDELVDALYDVISYIFWE